MSMRRRIERLGAGFLDGAGAAAELWQVFCATIASVFSGRGKRPPGEIANQMYQIGNRSLVFVAVTLGALGMVMMYQTCLQVNRITGDLTQVGPEFLKVIVHDFGPTITAMMLATRVGAGIAAEIGSMKVTEQIDALRMSGVAPIHYLITPRVVASVVMTLCLTIFAICITWGAAGFTAYASFGVNPRTFFILDRVGWPDAIIGLSKAFSYGLAIPVIAGFCGLRARGSSEGVGWATTAAVIGGSFAVILLDFILSGLGYVLMQRGPA
jgi:phospholipid/cholesterol/gamma-HCH transport system permease protein